MTSIRPKDLAARVTALTEPVIEQLGYELIQVEVSNQPGGGILRLYLDTVPPGDDSRGVTADDCGLVSRTLSDLFDVEEPALLEAYGLEVSSPGLFRPLSKPAHFSRVIGQRVKVKTYQKVNNRRAYTGALVAATGEQITVEVDGQLYEIALSDVAKANLEPELHF